MSRAGLGKLQTLGRIPRAEKGFYALNSWGRGGKNQRKNKFYEARGSASTGKVVLEHGHAC